MEDKNCLVRKVPSEKRNTGPTDKGDRDKYFSIAFTGQSFDELGPIRIVEPNLKGSVLLPLF